MFWGALSGFASCIAQAGGPPYQMYVLSQKLPKMTFVGTTAIFFATVNWLKVVPYFALGQFSTKGLGTSLVLLPLAIATNLLGFWLVRVTPQELFYKITLVLMFLISLELVREGVIADVARLTSARPLANVVARGNDPMAKTPYDTDLDRNPANFQPLTPLGFLERAAAVFPRPHRHHPRAAAAHLRRILRARAAAGLGAGQARHQARRHGLGAARQYAGDAGMPLRRADDARACSTRSTRGSMRRSSPSRSTTPRPRS